MKLRTITNLGKSGLIAYVPEHGITLRFDRKETEHILKKTINWKKLDDHCELVHINITSKCNFRCPECYMPKGDYDMPVKDFKHIVDQCVANKVHQITLGGGDPFLYKNIQEIVDYSTKRINVCTTINGTNRLPKHIVKKFRQVNISYHKSLPDMKNALMWLKNIGVKRGINYVYHKETMDVVEDIARIAKETEAELLLLQYKPVIGDWKNYISPEESFKVAKELANRKNFGVCVDGACVLNCMMKKRFMTVQIDSTVTPCSFVKEPNMGNILKQDFKDIWKNRGEVIVCPYMKDEDQRKLSF